MKNFFSKYKFILIGIAVIFAIFIGYGMLKSAPEEEGSVSKTVVGSNVGVVGGAGSLGANNFGDEFVLQLLAIQSINFNTEFFSDAVYKGLIDQSRPLGDRPVGRPNPFYPIGQDNGFVGGTTAGLTGPASTGTGFTVTSTSSGPVATTTATSTRTTPRR
jgi:hypothetical protein